MFCRCINAVIAGSEYVRSERTAQQKKSLSNGHAAEMSDTETLNLTSIEANIKSAMQIFVKCAAGIVLDSWSDSSRYSVKIAYRHHPLFLSCLSLHIEQTSL